jgi:hypothetical protein
MNFFTSSLNSVRNKLNPLILLIMKKKIAAFAFALSIGVASAQQPAVMMSTTPGWHKIASTTVDFTKERDEVSVLGADHFSAIKFMVTDAPVDIEDLEIWFENGTKQDVALRTPLEVGKESRVIDIQGGAQDIDKIIFVYKTLPNRSDVKAEVTIYGLKPDENASNKMNDRDHTMGNADQDRMNNNRMDKDRDHANMNKNNDKGITKNVPTPRLEVNDKTGWHKIGETIVSFNKERDEIAVLGADRYAKLKFKVTDAGIIINDMTISYEDGTKQDVPVSATFNAGEESRVIDIPGAEKDIARISFVYHTIPNQAKDKAHLEIWGYKSNADKSTGMK